MNRTFRLALFVAVTTLCLTVSVPRAQAQIHVGINLGPEPVCPYGYYDYAPYRCAPYGYYGPEWFNSNIFLGAGPWFRGHDDFRGHIDNRYDPRHGYHGPYPNHNDQRFNHFHGNEMRDGHGHVVHENHGRH